MTTLLDITLAQGPLKLLEAFELREGPASKLPPAPKDPTGEGRHTSWVIAFSEPGIWYRFDGDDEQTWIEIDEAWIDRQVRLFGELTKGGYSAPVLKEHKPDGERFGDVLLAQKWRDPKDGRVKLLTGIAWALPDARERIRLGRLKYMSGGLGTIEDEQGRRFEGVLLEHSIVAAPYQKQIDAHRGRHILFSESPTMKVSAADLAAAIAEFINSKSAEGEGEGDEPDAEMMEDGDEGEEAEAPEEDEGGEGVEAMDKPVETSEQPTSADSGSGNSDNDGDLRAQLKAAQERIDALEADKLRADFDAGYPAGAVLVLSEDLKDTLYELATRCPEQMAKIDAALTTRDKLAEVNASEQAPSKPKKKPTKKKRPSTFAWNTRVGETQIDIDLGPDKEPIDEDDVNALHAVLLKEHGGDKAKAFAALKERIKARGL